MALHARQLNRPALLTSAALLLLCAALFTFLALAPNGVAARTSAEMRWATQGLDDYSVALEVEIRGERCFQQLDVRNGVTEQVVLDTCASPWLNRLAVPQLFRIVDELQEIPASRCHPNNQDCACHRVFLTRRIDYDPVYGYPKTILTRSEVQMHWTHTDFWEYLLDRRELPSCAPAPRLLMVRVLWLAPRA